MLDNLPLRPKSPGKIYPSNPSNHLYDLPPQNHQGRFTPQIVCMISPPKIAFISTFLSPKSDIN